MSLSTASIDLLSLKRLVREVGSASVIHQGGSMNIRYTIWEDNQAYLKLANF